MHTFASSSRCENVTDSTRRWIRTEDRGQAASTSLYLDTARMGPMSGRAQRAHVDFVRLAGEEAGSFYFDQFFRNGFSSWPVRLRRRFPGLAGWQGMADLERDLRRLTGAPDECRVLLASRTAGLMQFAARLFAERCQNVLVTDLCWPGYAAILHREAERTGFRLTTVDVLRSILRGGMTGERFVRYLTETYIARRCDGLFLPAVDHRGIRLPMDALLRDLRRRTSLRCIVIDGAQALGHVPVNLAAIDVDLYLAGCHKWLGAHHPLGLGFLARRRSEAAIATQLQRLIREVELDDPLLTFSQQLQHGTECPFGETVNPAPLFSCRGAVSEVLQAPVDVAECLRVRLENARRLVPVAVRCGWSVLRPRPEFPSGILLLEARSRAVRHLSADALRRRLIDRGVAATTYPLGLVRLSMPAARWTADQLNRLQSALSMSHPPVRRRPVRAVSLVR